MLSFCSEPHLLHKSRWSYARMIVLDKQRAYHYLIGIQIIDMFTEFLSQFHPKWSDKNWMIFIKRGHAEAYVNRYLFSIWNRDTCRLVSYSKLGAKHTSSVSLSDTDAGRNKLRFPLSRTTMIVGGRGAEDLSQSLWLAGREKSVNICVCIRQLINMWAATSQQSTLYNPRVNSKFTCWTI